MAHRGARHAALRADEAGRPDRSAHRPRRRTRSVQLRQDNLAGDHFSLVGFQTQIKWGEQARVLRLIPGLEQAEFVRFGMVHRNTYVNGPTVLAETWQVRDAPDAVLRRPDVGRRGLRRVGGVGAARRPERRGAGQRRSRVSAPPRTTAIGALALLRVARRTRRTTSRRTSPSASWSRWTRPPRGKMRAQAGDGRPRARGAGRAGCSAAETPHDRPSQGVPQVSRAEPQRVAAHGARLRERSVAVPRCTSAAAARRQGARARAGGARSRRDPRLSRRRSRAADSRARRRRASWRRCARSCATCAAKS